ncbi:hypothetical protein Selin_1428 [Desulfurispirillum indicum S5]|uniref:Uncharacterized protein n=1 Tax=Desulfurispirillum indicum (strain ATCC BAA-1389 / DSM 22839 / S5) TaxID=653733 RepID=E6W6C6_DESIS|nr:DUF6573 family protein [Desulfurispirillum indicum]ADU66162.1 hypothetical protein Selin_1428 [Desulfurispirillum indicum S5]
MTIQEIFGEAVYSYSRAQAIADGILVDVSETANEAGFTVPVAMTSALWEDAVSWDNGHPSPAIPWQLADDPETYGDNAGHWILVSSDGENELPGGPWPTQEQAEQEARKHIQEAHQDESGRLWDVLYMAAWAIKNNRVDGPELKFSLKRIPKGDTRARLVTYKAYSGPGDNGEHVITLMLPHED